MLQEQEFERLGSTRTIRVDIRLVAATNRDLAAMVAERQFRSDLYYRLNVFPIVSPPLRDAQEDIPPLVRYFAQKFATRMNKRIDDYSGRDDGGAGSLSLAGQHSRAREFHRARRHPVARLEARGAARGVEAQRKPDAAGGHAGARRWRKPSASTSARRCSRPTG